MASRPWILSTTSLLRSLNSKASSSKDTIFRCWMNPMKEFRSPWLSSSASASPAVQGQSPKGLQVSPNVVLLVRTAPHNKQQAATCGTSACRKNCSNATDIATQSNTIYAPGLVIRGNTRTSTDKTTDDLRLCAATNAERCQLVASVPTFPTRAATCIWDIPLT